MIYLKLTRLLICILLAFTLTISIIVLPISIAINRTVFNPAFVKNMLSTTNSYALVYSQIPSIISTFLPNNLSKFSAIISRCVINNIPEKGLKSQSEIIIDNFYSYLEGSNNSPSVDLTPIKGEINSLTKSPQFTGLTKSINHFNNPLNNIPNNVNLDKANNYEALSYLPKLYRLSQSLPPLLLYISIICIMLLLILNRSIEKLLIQLSISLLVSGFVLAFIYINQRFITNIIIPAILNHDIILQFKMLSISLHPAILFTLSSILAFVLTWSLSFGFAGLIILLLSQNKLRKLIFKAFSLAATSMFVIPLRKIVSLMNSTNLKSPKEKEPPEALQYDEI